MAPSRRAPSGRIPPAGLALMLSLTRRNTADEFVDNDANGRMDDLNGDGLIDYRDAQVIPRSEEQVESAHPGVLGGGGVDKATREHGPFAHIDVRGRRARWGLLQ